MANSTFGLTEEGKDFSLMSPLTPHRPRRMEGGPLEGLKHEQEERGQIWTGL